MKFLGIAALLALGLSGCASARADRVLPKPYAAESTAAITPSGSPIKHVVLIIQERRSFENLFAGWPGADAPLVGSTHFGRIRLHSMTYADDRSLVDSYGMMRMVLYDGGKLDGFGNNRFTDGTPAGTYPYAFMKHAEIAPYRALASQYVLADHMFTTEFGSSFTAHQDLVAGTTFVNRTEALADNPDAATWGCDAARRTREALVKNGDIVLPLRKGVFPCIFQYRTIANDLDAHGISWTYYVEALASDDASGRQWSAFDAIKAVRYGDDWTTHLSSPTSRILEDAKSGRLPSVSWVIPRTNWSDDPASTSDRGPSWVAAIVNAIGRGPDWSSTAIVILWSESGGWYDSANPPLFSQINYTGYGLRVPCIIVSPYARRDYVSHTAYGFGSALKFIEQVFSLPPISAGSGVYTDEWANSIADALDFSKPPRRFVPIHAKYPPSTFEGH